MKNEIWCPKLNIMYYESFQEKNIIKDLNYDYALFPKKIYGKINNNFEKNIDYCFIGAFSFTRGQDYGFENRKWIIDFANQNFNKNSFFVNTTKNKI